MKMRRAICGLVALSLSSVSLYMPAAHAALVGTEQVVQTLQGEGALRDARERLTAFMQREDVQSQLQAQGVDPVQAQERVAAMSDDEVQQLAGKLDQLPAGGDALGILLFLFLVFLITDIAGYTDIYPFVKKNKR